MNRRRVLSLLSSLIPFAGCISPATETSNGAPERAEDIFIVLQNGTSEQVTMAVTVTSDDLMIFEDERVVAPDATQYIYPELIELGNYEMTVSIDGRRERGFPFKIEEYDIRMGSNINVWLSDDGVRIGMEE